MRGLRPAGWVFLAMAAWSAAGGCRPTEGSASGLDALPAAYVTPKTLPLAVAAAWPGAVGLATAAFSPAPLFPTFQAGFYVAPGAVPAGGLPPASVQPRTVTYAQGCPLITCDGAGCPLSASAVATPPLPYDLTYRTDSGSGGCLLATPCPLTRSPSGLCTSRIVGGSVSRFSASTTQEQVTDFTRNEMLTQQNPDDGHWHRAVATSLYDVRPGALYHEHFSADEETDTGEFFRAQGDRSWSSPASDTISISEDSGSTTPTASVYRRFQGTLTAIQRDLWGDPLSLVANGSFTFGSQGPGAGWGAIGRVTVTLTNLVLQICPGKGEVPNGGRIDVYGQGHAELDVHNNCDGQADLEFNGLFNGTYAFPAGGQPGQILYAPPALP